MLTLDALRSYGANVDEGLGRCMNNEALYTRFVGKCMEDSNFGKLKEALDQEDWTGAFEAAHALKGVLGNLSLTPIYEPVQKLTDLLRPREACDYKELLEQILKAKGDLLAIING